MTLINEIVQTELFLSAIGQLYQLGLNPRVDRLYPRVQYPVSRNTQSISSLIRWDHSDNWLVTQYPEYYNPGRNSEYAFKVDLKQKAFEFYADHCIDGQLLLPATGHLMLVWQMLARMKGESHHLLPVQFDNVTVHRPVKLFAETPTFLVVRLLTSSGQFSVSEGASVVVTGTILAAEEHSLKLQHILSDESFAIESSLRVRSEGIYRELEIRGYEYGPAFRVLEEASADGRRAKITNTSNWVVFADAMLQLAVFGQNVRTLSLAVGFQTIRCNPRLMAEAAQSLGSDRVFNAIYDPRINVCVAKGLEFVGTEMTGIPRGPDSRLTTDVKFRIFAYHENSGLESSETGKTRQCGQWEQCFEDMDEELVDTEHAFLNTATRSDLSSLRWFESQDKYWPSLDPNDKKSGEVFCYIYYSALNLRDLMLASGRTTTDNDSALGIEFAGRDQKGRRVMGMVSGKGLATSLVVDDSDLMWPIPDDWTMEEASTVPVVYATAYYALVIRARLSPGERVLIHCGSGGVGQAAISIALNLGCKVYTTVGSLEKRQFLKKVFPQLTDMCFASSRDTSFEEHVLIATNGLGVDVVLNSLSGERLRASVRSLAKHGRLVHITKDILHTNYSIGNITKLTSQCHLVSILLMAVL